MIEKIAAAFIPIFFAIDVIGILPVFMGMTRHIYIDRRQRIVRQASITAFAISISFLYFGREIFKFLGITVPDFKIGGGILLLIIAIMDLLFSHRSERIGDKEETMGIVPIGMPLIIGPGVLTALLLSASTNGYTATLIALVLNILLVWLVFYHSEKVLSIIGEAGAIAVGKVFALLLTAIAVMMIRSGVFELLILFRNS